MGRIRIPYDNPVYMVLLHYVIGRHIHTFCIKADLTHSPFTFLHKHAYGLAFMNTIL
jgi:hypothetical protein